MYMYVAVLQPNYAFSLDVWVNEIWACWIGDNNPLIALQVK